MLYKNNAVNFELLDFDSFLVQNKIHPGDFDKMKFPVDVVVFELIEFYFVFICYLFQNNCTSRGGSERVKTCRCAIDGASLSHRD